MRNPIVEQDLQFIKNARLPWKKFEGKRVLISGASGFLPAYMVETLLYLNETLFKKKVKVYVLVRDLKKAKKRFRHYAKRPDLEYIVQDVCKPLNIKGDIHYIIHAASHSSPKYFGKDPSGTIAANTIGTYNLLELAKTKGSEGFLYFSSAEIYGEIPARSMPITEDMGGYIDPVAVRACYAEGKRAGETMCASWFHQYGVPARIVRPFHTYGPGMDLDDGRVYADFISDILHGRNIIIKSNGTARRTFCYLADATVGFFAVLLKGRNGEAYNVADKNQEISVRGLAQLIARLFPEKGLAVKHDLSGQQKGYIKSGVERAHPATAKLQGLGWTAKHSIKDGFKRTIRSYSWPIS